MGESEESGEALTSTPSDEREARIQALLAYVGGGLDFFARQQGDEAAFKALLALWTSSQESDVIDDPRLRPLIGLQMAKFGIRGALHQTAQGIRHTLSSAAALGRHLQHKIIDPPWQSEDD